MIMPEVRVKAWGKLLFPRSVLCRRHPKGRTKRVIEIRQIAEPSVTRNVEDQIGPLERFAHQDPLAQWQPQHRGQFCRRRGLKKLRMSSARSCGCSIAAK